MQLVKRNGSRKFKIEFHRLVAKGPTDKCSMIGTVSHSKIFILCGIQPQQGLFDGYGEHGHETGYVFGAKKN